MRTKPNQMMGKLQEVRAWAQGKIDARQEPPWAWYQYMKLIETCDTILASMNATVKTASLQQSESRPGNVIQLAGSTSRQDAAPHHPDSETPQMPM